MMNLNEFQMIRDDKSRLEMKAKEMFELFLTEEGTFSLELEQEYTNVVKKIIFEYPEKISTGLFNEISLIIQETLRNRIQDF